MPADSLATALAAKRLADFTGAKMDAGSGLKADLPLYSAHSFTALDLLTPQDGETLERAIARVAGVARFLIPPGSMVDWASDTPPNGYFLCNGAAVSASTYAALYAVIGGSWNTFAGQGAPGGGLFRVPLIRDRFVLYRSGGGSYGLLGTGGADTVTLSGNQLPVHSHSLSNTNGRIHTNFAFPEEDAREAESGDGVTFRPYQGTTFGVQASAQALFSDGARTEDMGGNEAHENRPPFVVLNKIIKY